MCPRIFLKGVHMKRYVVGLAFAVALSIFIADVSMAGYQQGPPPGAQPQGPGRGAGGGGGAGGRGGPVAPAGPPAPVPPEVAIQRPSADDLAKINAALKRFVDTNTSADSALLKKWADLINVPTPRPNTAIAPVQTQVRNNDRHNGFVETAKN